MADEGCHSTAPLGSRAAAKVVILEDLGVRRVAGWCNVSEAAVYQWLSRGTDLEPIPVKRVSAIVNGARADGLAINARVLWPAMAALA